MSESFIHTRSNDNDMQWANHLPLRLHTATFHPTFGSLKAKGGVKRERGEKGQGRDQRGKQDKKQTGGKGFSVKYPHLILCYNISKV